MLNFLFGQLESCHLETVAKAHISDVAAVFSATLGLAVY